jgi:hypothetical protein
MVDREHSSSSPAYRSRRAERAARRNAQRGTAGPEPHAARPAVDDTVEPQASAPAPRTQRPRYVRQRAPHQSQGLVDDLATDDADLTTYAHDSNFAVRGANPLSGMAYRRSRSRMTKIQRSTRYGRYLEIPKGKRSIFFSRVRAQRRHSLLGILVSVILLAMAALLVWSLIQKLPRA